MTDTTEYICGVITLCLTVGSLIIGYHLHMRHIYADIAHEEADELFHDYVEHCEYRVHNRIVTTVEVDGHHAGN